MTRSSSAARLVGKHLHDYFRVMTAEDAEPGRDALLEFADTVPGPGLEPVSRNLRRQLESDAEQSRVKK